MNSCCAHLLGRGMLGGGLGTVGMGIGRGPLPGTWTPAAATLRPSREPLPSGSAGSGFWGGLGLSKSWRDEKNKTSGLRIRSIEGEECPLWRFGSSNSDIEWLDFQLQCSPSSPPSPEPASELQWPAPAANLDLSSTFLFVGFTEDASAPSNYKMHCETVAMHGR